MTVYVDRAKLLSLLGASVRTTRGGRPLTRLNADLVKERMPSAQRARLVCSMSGGDESHTVTSWFVPGIGQAQLILDRVKLGKAIAEAEPWSPPRPTRAESLARLKRMRAASVEQLGLFG